METIYAHRLEPKTGLAVEVKHGDHLRLTDLEGKQVVDLVVFNLDDLRERLSTSYSRMRYLPPVAQEGYYPHNSVAEGDWLMSGLCRPMMTLIKETTEPKGVHGSHHRMCNRFFYEVFGDTTQRGCIDIISEAVAPYGILPQDLPDSIDFFMNYPFDCNLGHFQIKAPVSRPGDYVELRAEMNCLVAMSNCPEDVVSEANAGLCTPMLVEVFHDEEWEPRPILSPDEWLDEQLVEFRRHRTVEGRREA